MKPTLADISYAEDVALERQFPNIAKWKRQKKAWMVHGLRKPETDTLRRINGVINSHAKRTPRDIWGQNWHNTLVIIRGRIGRGEAWNDPSTWIVGGPMSDKHMANVQRLLRRMKYQQYGVLKLGNTVRCRYGWSKLNDR